MIEDETRVPQDLFRKTKNASRGIQNYVSEVGRSPTTGLPNSTLNKLLRINHRRKLQFLDEKKSILPIWKRKSFAEENLRERFSQIATTHNKESETGSGKRASWLPAPEPLRKSPSKLIGQVLKSKTRLSLVYDEESTQTKTICKNDSQGEQIRRKLSLKKHSIVSKKSKNSAKTSSDFMNRSYDEPLVDLISKFKFQNLKTANTTFGEQEPLAKIEKRPILAAETIYFAPFRSEYDTQRKGRDRMNKTMMKLGWEGEKIPSNITRKVSVLSPWQLDGKEGGSTNDLLRL